MKKLNPSFLLTVLLFVVLSAMLPIQSQAHCEIPCGIYEDSVRIMLIKEDIATIEKSMKMIEELSAEENPNFNQLVRWVMNKEEHAKKIQEIVSQYFLHQRIKIVDPSDTVAYKKYQTMLTQLHQLSVFAMKSKQSTDHKWIESMLAMLSEFESTYFHSHDDH